VNNTIVSGTKAGSEVERRIPIPRELVAILLDFRKTTKWSAADNFILSRPDGAHFHARLVSRMLEAIREKAGVYVTVHGLRHTYGREFAIATGGNMKALQAILGHSVSATTDLYSNLGTDRIKGFSEAVSFGLGVKKSED
jgi:integrase